VPNPLGRDRAAQGGRDVILDQQITEAAGAVLPGKRNHGRADGRTGRRAVFIAGI